MVEVHHHRTLVARLQHTGNTPAAWHIELDDVAGRIVDGRVCIAVECSGRQALHQLDIALAETLGWRQLERCLLALCEPNQLVLEGRCHMTSTDLHGGG